MSKGRTAAAAAAAWLHQHELHLPLGPRNIRRLGWAKRLVGATSLLLIHTTATTQPKSVAHTGLIASSYTDTGMVLFLERGWDGFLMWVGFLSCHGVCIFSGCHRSLIKLARCMCFSVASECHRPSRPLGFAFSGFYVEFHATD